MNVDTLNKWSLCFCKWEMRLINWKLSHTHFVVLHILNIPIGCYASKKNTALLFLLSEKSSKSIGALHGPELHRLRLVATHGPETIVAAQRNAGLLSN